MTHTSLLVRQHRRILRIIIGLGRREKKHYSLLKVKFGARSSKVVDEIPNFDDTRIPEEC